MVLGLFPRSRERGSLRGGLRVVGASGLLLAGRARRFCVFRLVALGSLGEGSQAHVGVGGIATPKLRILRRLDSV